MFRGLVAVGNDVDPSGNIRTGSILIESMTLRRQLSENLYKQTK